MLNKVNCDEETCQQAGVCVTQLPQILKSSFGRAAHEGRMMGRGFLAALWGLPMLCALAGGAVADIGSDVPADYPSHVGIGDCNLHDVRAKLQDYNHRRLEIAAVLRHIAEDQPMAAETQRELLGYAANLEELRTRLPDPDPDSNAFRNFDLRLGLTFTSIALFLNSNDEQLSERFFRDRDDPNSELGKYLARLDLSRQQYLDGLQVARDGDCRT